MVSILSLFILMSCGSNKKKPNRTVIKRTIKKNGSFIRSEEITLDIEEKGDGKIKCQYTNKRSDGKVKKATFENNKITLDREVSIKDKDGSVKRKIKELELDGSVDEALKNNDKSGPTAPTEGGVRSISKEDGFDVYEKNGYRYLVDDKGRVRSYYSIKKKKKHKHKRPRVAHRGVVLQEAEEVEVESKDEIRQDFEYDDKGRVIRRVSRVRAEGNKSNGSVSSRAGGVKSKGIELEIVEEITRE